ncbi:hypothetical protein M9978_20255 [Sphingomonas sp. MG17]|uniref:Uncharacterized protein n=1 Tax=Sphingomonas tagetis TaxID=2949092 RepID=A0A9X2HUA9_9SPHN|nr:hypothetical protein [Sphingomonas tagetis]MCP3732755.1 hypothetical protein [Sphingomonas tagetis]
MNGLVSPDPSPGALRLAVGGYVLLFVEFYLAMLRPDLALDLRWVVWPVTFVSAAAFMVALCGLPAPEDFGGRDGR